MEHFRHHVLADTRFAEDQNMNAPRRHAGHHFVEFTHRRIANHDLPSRKTHDRFIAARLPFRSGGRRSERAARGRAADDEDRAADVNGFTDVDGNRLTGRDPSAAHARPIAAVGVFDGEAVTQMQEQVRSRGERVGQSHVRALRSTNSHHPRLGQAVSAESVLLHDEKTELASRRMRRDVRDLTAVHGHGCTSLVRHRPVAHRGSAPPTRRPRRLVVAKKVTGPNVETFEGPAAAWPARLAR